MPPGTSASGDEVAVAPAVAEAGPRASAAEATEVAPAAAEPGRVRQGPGVAAPRRVESRASARAVPAATRDPIASPAPLAVGNAVVGAAMNGASMLAQGVAGDALGVAGAMVGSVAFELARRAGATERPAGGVSADVAGAADTDPPTIRPPAMLPVEAALRPAPVAIAALPNHPTAEEIYEGQGVFAARLDFIELTMPPPGVDAASWRPDVEALLDGRDRWQAFVGWLDRIGLLQPIARTAGRTEVAAGIQGGMASAQLQAAPTATTITAGGLVGGTAGGLGFGGTVLAADRQSTFLRARTREVEALFADLKRALRSAAPPVPLPDDLTLSSSGRSHATLRVDAFRRASERPVEGGASLLERIVDARMRADLDRRGATTTEVSTTLQRWLGMGPGADPSGAPRPTWGGAASDTLQRPVLDPSASGDDTARTWVRWAADEGRASADREFLDVLRQRRGADEARRRDVTAYAAQASLFIGGVLVGVGAAAGALVAPSIGLVLLAHTAWHLSPALLAKIGAVAGNTLASPVLPVALAGGQCAQAYHEARAGQLDHRFDALRVAALEAAEPALRERLAQATDPPLTLDSTGPDHDSLRAELFAWHAARSAPRQAADPGTPGAVATTH